MEIPTWLFFSFWGLTSSTFLHLSFHALDKTHHNNSVPPLFVLFLKHSLAISSFSSSTYALKYRPQHTHQSPSSYLFIFYAILSASLATTTDGIILRATLITFYSRSLHFLLHFKSLLIPFLPNLLDSGEITKKIVLGITIAEWAWLVFSLRGEIFFIAYALIEKGSLSLFHLIVKLVSAVFSLEWLCYLPIFFLGFLWFFLLFPLWLSRRFLPFVFETILTLGTGEYDSTAETRGRAAVVMALEVSLFFVSVEKNEFSPIAVVLLSHLISAVTAAASRFWEEEEEGKWKECMAKVKEGRMGKLIELGVGAAGAIYFKKVLVPFTSSHEVLYLYMGAMWLANLTLLGFPFDFGVFYFIVIGGVVVGWCSWLVCALALLLFALRLKLESLALVYEEDDYIEVGVFSY